MNRVNKGEYLWVLHSGPWHIFRALENEYLEPREIFRSADEEYMWPLEGERAGLKVELAFGAVLGR